jgi:hypothetical protein
MSSSSLADFDWSYAPQSVSVWVETLRIAAKPYRVDTAGNVIPIRLGTQHDAADPPPFTLPGLPLDRLKLFLAKYLILCWLYTMKGRDRFPRLVFRRLLRYLQYYQIILADLRSGKRDSFDFWWGNETSMEYMEHSSRRIPRQEGPRDDEGVIDDNEVDWLLGDVLDQSNFALVSQKDLNKIARHVEDWVQDEVVREVGPNLDPDWVVLTDGECDS